MMLRESKHKGDLTFEAVVTLADGAKGPDPDGRRSEFVYLVKTAAGLAGGRAGN
jgi:Ca-activated chloride channel family protein